VLLLLAALAARVYHLGAPTLSGDEWFMYRNWREGPGWIVHQAHTFEPHPLLYYLGFWAWLGVAGTTEWAMRYPSVLFGVVTCAAVWRLTRGVASAVPAAAALALAVVNPYQVAQSQNARNYAMVAALATVATVALLAAQRRGGRAWYGYGLALLLALNTHLNAMLAAAAHVGWMGLRWLLHRERPPLEAFRTGAVVLVLFLGWIVYAWPALTSYPGYFPERVGFVAVLQRTTATFAFGQVEPPRRALVGLVALVVLLGVTWSLRRAARGGDDGLLIVLVAGLPVVGMALMFLVRPMFEERYLIVAAPATIALIGIGTGALGSGLWNVLSRAAGELGDRWPRAARGAFGAAPAVGLLALTLPFLRGYFPLIEQSRPDWRGLAAWIQATARPGDVVLITGNGVADLYDYYQRDATPTMLVTDPATVGPAVDGLPAMHARGAFHLPYLDAPPDQIAHDRLTAIGFPAEGRWFRAQHAQYVALPPPGFPPAHAIGARWSGSIELRDAAVGPATVSPGDAVDVALTWTTIDAAPDLKLSLRLLAPDGKQVAQLDRRPLDDARPFPTVKPGEAVRDGHALRLPPDAPPGSYEAALLLYQPSDAKAVAPDADASLLRLENRDLVRLGTIEVGRR
jgi:4-amino-4-deoxy-L-arabinose transferase-like glycosyltransferase